MHSSIIFSIEYFIKTFNVSICRDVMIATGKSASETVARVRLTQDCVIGYEFSGVGPSGNRVMGLINNRGLSNLCVADQTYAIWNIPHHWSLEDAATVPSVYVTCIYALYIKGE